MPTIFAASESTVLVDGEPVEGVQGIDYRTRHDRTNIYALGSTERVGVVSGAYEVQGRLRVASASSQPREVAALRHSGHTRRKVGPFASRYSRTASPWRKWRRQIAQLPESAAAAIGGPDRTRIR